MGVAVFPCPLQSRLFAGWSGKHFPTHGAKCYKYARHCNCVMRLLPSIGSPCCSRHRCAWHGAILAQQTPWEPRVPPNPLCR